jgi:hypothetical protein
MGNKFKMIKSKERKIAFGNETVSYKNVRLNSGAGSYSLKKNSVVGRLTGYLFYGILFVFVVTSLLIFLG